MKWLFLVYKKNNFHSKVPLSKTEMDVYVWN